MKHIYTVVVKEVHDHPVIIKSDVELTWEQLRDFANDNDGERIDDGSIKYNYTLDPEMWGYFDKSGLSVRNPN